MMDQSIINFAVYEDGNDFMGIAKVTLPDLTALTQTVSGAGIAGNIEAVILGHFEAMTMTMNFRTLNKHSVKLSEPRYHNLDLRVAQQSEDNVKGRLNVEAFKHVMTVLPKADKGGTIAPASQADGSGEYAVHRWATYLDGQLVRDIDPLNFKCMINGVDYLEDVRKALGK